MRHESNFWTVRGLMARYRFWARDKRLIDKFLEHEQKLVSINNDSLEDLANARQANAHVEILQGEDPVALIVDYAAKNGITQIFVGHSQEAGWVNYWKPDPVERLIMEAEGIDIRIFPQGEYRK